MSDVQELALAAAAFLLASSVFRWNSQNPKKAAAERNADTLMAVMTHFIFKECHAFVMASAQGLQDDYYESAEASQQFSELDHAYPEPTAQHSAPVPRSTEDDHFSYAGSSYSEPAAQYSDLDHMFELDRKRGAVRTAAPQSTSSDHFSYAASAVDDEDVNEFDHFAYSGNQCSEASRTVAPSQQSASRDHFSFAATSVDDSEERNDLDHFEYGEHSAVAPRTASTPRSTAEDHFSFAATSMEEVHEPNELDHFDYGERRVVQSSRQGTKSTSRDHFSYAGSCYEDDSTNEFDHFAYAAQPRACGAY